MWVQGSNLYINVMVQWQKHKSARKCWGCYNILNHRKWCQTMTWLRAHYNQNMGNQESRSIPALLRFVIPWCPIRLIRYVVLSTLIPWKWPASSHGHTGNSKPTPGHRQSTKTRLIWWLMFFCLLVDHFKKNDVMLVFDRIVNDGLQCLMNRLINGPLLKLFFQHFKGQSLETKPVGGIGSGLTALDVYW